MQPFDKKKYLGLEIEFYFSNSMTYEEARHVLETHLKTATDFELGNDGSIEPPMCKACKNYNYDPCTCARTAELRILLRQDKIEQVMKELRGAFKVIRPRANSSCGLHVHIDARNRKREVLFNNLVSCQELFFLMQPKSRRTNTFCQKNEHKDFDMQKRIYDRYRAINAQSFDEHRTIEVRLHKGTVSTHDIENWLKVLVAVANKRSKMKEDIVNVVDFQKALKLRKKQTTYVANCIKKYNKTKALSA
jgi:hypothetical protein